MEAFGAIGDMFTWLWNFLTWLVVPRNLLYSIGLITVLDMFFSRLSSVAAKASPTTWFRRN